MKYVVGILIGLIVLLSWHESLAWGGRGHDTLCESATYLIENKELKTFLMSRPHVMGHLCNIPDIYWRSLPNEMTREGNPTHFIDTEILPFAIKDFPLDLAKLMTDFNGKKRANREGDIKSLPHDLGTVWWRADQFYRLAVAEKDNLATLKVHSGPMFGTLERTEITDKNPFNSGVYNFYVNLGLMGHFVGDASQPFHSTDDFDGYNKGHGGIHAYYEETLVSAMDGDLSAKVIKEARKLKNASRKEAYLTAATSLEKMRALSMLSIADIKDVIKADLLKKPSEVKEERGMKIRTAAEREPLEKTMKRFEPLLVKHLARGAALLADMWDKAYVDAGSPKLSAYKSFKYPLTPDFVMPDYYDVQTNGKK
jgi:hypothetical protein